MSVLEQAQMIASLASDGISVYEPIPSHDYTFARACAFHYRRRRRALRHNAIKDTRFIGGILLAAILPAFGVHWAIATGLFAGVLLWDALDGKQEVDS